MRFLADVNVDGRIVRGLRDDGHEVEWLAESPTDRRRTDLSLMNRAYHSRQIILTNDRGFTGYVFKDRIPTSGVVLLRVAIVKIPRSQSVARSLEALRASQSRLDHFTTIYPDRIDHERLPERHDPSAQL